MRIYKSPWKNRLCRFAVLSGEENRMEIKINGFEFNNGEQEIFSACKNIGQVHLKPSIKLTILNKEEQLMEEIELDSMDLIGRAFVPW